MNTCVFSNHFIWCHYKYLLATQPQRKDIITAPTISEAIDAWIERADLRNHHWCPEIFMSLHPENNVADKNIFNRICADNDLRSIEQWVTKNILLCIRKDWKIKTQNVKLRIVAGMLNNLVNKRCITSDENIYIFNNIVTNVYGLRKDMLYADLPF